MKTFWGRCFLGVVLCGSHAAFARPADFTGHYQILQSRLLALTFTRDFAIQDGSLVALSALDVTRPWCRSTQAAFDDYDGEISVKFVVAPDGSEHATLTTLPSSATKNPTTLTCVANNGFSGALDLSISLGRIVELSR